MYFNYDPTIKLHKNILGAIAENQDLEIFVETDAQNVSLVIKLDNGIAKSYPMEKSSGGFFVRLNGLKKGLYWYSFLADNIQFGAGDKLKTCQNGNDYQLIVYDKNYTTPNFLKGGIIYQIFPDRFCNDGEFSVESGKVKGVWGEMPTYRNSDGLVLNNEFFGGNFKGIEKKLDYLAKLNVNLLYLNPVNKAFSSHRYDTIDYLEFDSVLGSQDDFISLKNKAEKLGIKIIYDGVYNHVGCDSVYFDKGKKYGGGACSGEKSPYFEWFNFTHFPDKYDCWWDFETLPSIKKDCKSFQNFITNTVIEHNLKLGFSGVRLDVADELSDDFIKEIRKAIKSNNGENFIVGEVWEDATNKIAYDRRREYFLGEELDSVMNYPLKDAIVNYLLSGSVSLFVNTVKNQLNNYPKISLDVLMNILSTHDSVRILTELSRSKIITDKDLMAFENLTPSELKKGKKLLKMAFTILFTIYGVPCIYYGDEIGMSGNLDPYNRQCFNWESIDYELLDFVKKLSKIRNSFNVFKLGEFNLLYAKDGVIIYERVCGDDQVIVMLNKSNHDFVIETNEQVFDLIDEKTINNKFTLLKNSSVILTKNADNRPIGV